MSQPNPVVANLLRRLLQDSSLGKALKGRKTYIVGIMMVLRGVYALLLGDSMEPTFANPDPMEADDAFGLILEGLGVSTLRAGISKTGNGTPPSD